MSEKKTKMTWTEVSTLARAMVPRPGMRLYGVPRGGCVVAALAGRPVDNPQDAEAIVDDIVDSGATRAKWRKMWPRLPFLALVDKTKPLDRRMGWVEFPWEGDELPGEQNVARLIQGIGEDPNRPGLRDTPKRVVKALAEMTSGYQQDPATILARDFETDGYDEMVLSRGIEFCSLCEHHMLPFTGVAHVGYVPRRRIVGLSKMARLVECFARRLQVQERLTRQVAEAMLHHLKPMGVGVVVVGRHSCMSCRGVRKPGSDMVTSCMLGVLRTDASARAEFMALCGSAGSQA